jgi:hypothetical protein
MAELNAQDVIALSEGSVFVTIDGKNIPLIEVKEATADLEFNKEDVPRLGQRMVGNKVTSASSKGKLTTYFVSSMWNKIAADYLAGAGLPRMTMTATMEDKSSSLGKQVVTLGNFMPDKINLFNLEADDGVSENEMDFTFDSFNMTQALNELQR